MIELFLIYVFAAGFFLGQLCCQPRPNNVSPLIWAMVIIIATMLWPYFLTVTTIRNHRAKQARQPKHKI